MELIATNIGSTPKFRRPSCQDTIPDITFATESLVSAIQRVLTSVTYKTFANLLKYSYEPQNLDADIRVATESLVNTTMNFIITACNASASRKKVHHWKSSCTDGWLKLKIKKELPQTSRDCTKQMAKMRLTLNPQKTKKRKGNPPQHQQVEVDLRVPKA